MTNAVFELRKALGDDAKEPRFIQTVPRKGYRFLASVKAPTPEARKPPRAWPAGGALVGIVAAAGWYLARRDLTAPEPRVTPLTGFPGAEWWAAISPDGERVAYVWDGGKGGRLHALFVQSMGASDPLQLTETTTHEYSPVWSPDGREIAFLRQAKSESEVLVIPAMGGQERRVGSISAVDSPGSARYMGMDWSPDGRFLAVVDGESTPYAIVLLDLDTGDKRRVTSPPSNVWWDVQPAFSPDGKLLAFARMPGFIQNQIYLQSLDGGEPKLLVTVEGWVIDLGWTADGSAIVFSSGSEREAGTKLWSAPTSGGTPKVLPFGEAVHTFSISRTGERLVVDRRSWFNTDLWRIDGPAAKERREPTRLIASSRLDWGQEYSPDGTKIAFASERSGNNNIWVCESDGSGCFQLTDMERAAGPRWAPDGKHILFSAQESSEPDHFPYIVEVEGEFLRRVPGLDASDYNVNLSHDGRWLFFSSDRTGESSPWNPLSSRRIPK